MDMYLCSVIMEYRRRRPLVGGSYKAELHCLWKYYFPWLTDADTANGSSYTRNAGGV